MSLSPAEHRRLIAYISDGFDRTYRLKELGDAKAFPAGKGLYGRSYFFRATGLFNLDNTCNTWLARGLAEAGLPIEADDVRRASTLIRRLRAALETRQ